MATNEEKRQRDVTKVLALTTNLRATWRELPPEEIDKHLRVTEDLLRDMDARTGRRDPNKRRKRK